MEEEELCKGMPVEFASYLTYCKNLKFEEKPDYAYLKGMFTGLKKKMKKIELVFDWLKDEEKSDEETKVCSH